MKYDKESIYDNEIAPLMQKIIEICLRENLPMAAQFYLKEERDGDGDPLYCTTVIRPEGNSEGHEQIAFVAESMKYGKQGKPYVMAVTVRNGG